MVVDADEPKDPSTAEVAATASETDQETKKPAFELSEEVRLAILPLFKSIAEADVSRVTVELSAESLTGAQIVDSQTSTYQIGSIAPDQFTVYLKEPQQRLRVYCNGKEMIVAMSADAFFRAEEPIQTQMAVTSLPVAMGPYPEPVLALSLAGVDPAVFLLGAMKSVELVERGKFRGETPAIHFKGVQDDGVSWNLWITQGEQPKPLRLLVDLTPMLRAAGQVQVPDDYTYQLRFDFMSWRMSGEVDKGLFTFNPPKEAVEYKSLEDYFETISKVGEKHPLLGMAAPAFKTETLTGDKINSESLAGKVIVLDFWATWCPPCIASMPVISDVCSKYADKGVVFFAVNTGESAKTIADFAKKQGWTATIILDVDEKIADSFRIDALPQTIIVGPDKTIQAAHIGFDGEEVLRDLLSQELELLIGGGKLTN